MIINVQWIVILPSSSGDSFIPATRFSDLLIPLCFYVQEHLNIWLIPEPKKVCPLRYIYVNIAKGIFGKQVCSHILFVHALLGCDLWYILVKRWVWNLYRKVMILSNNPDSQQLISLQLETSVVARLREANSDVNLDILKYQRFPDGFKGFHCHPPKNVTTI